MIELSSERRNVEERESLGLSFATFATLITAGRWIQELCIPDSGSLKVGLALDIPIQKEHEENPCLK